MLANLGGSEANPPNWPDSVHIFSPSDSTSSIEAAVDAAYAVNGGDPLQTCDNGQFSDERFAFMFLPGTYTANVPVGYYTSVYGLGVTPSETVFASAMGVYAQQGCGDFSIGALDTFWRSAENFHTQASYAWPVGTGMTWAVSQAAPLRNVMVDKDLLLFQYLPEYCCAAGFASGGWASGVQVGGSVAFGSQQQWMTRNAHFQSGSDSTVWNTVVAGVLNGPTTNCGTADSGAVANAATVPLVAEKPYVTSNSGGATYQLIVPDAKSDSSGTPFDGTPDGYQSYDFSDVYVTQTDDSAATINGKLAEGLHVVVSPGIYQLEETLYIQNENQVLLGLGLATLVAPADGTPAVKVADVAGVRVAGVLLQASAGATSAFLQVGESGAFPGDAGNPTVLTDVFVRVGGPDTTEVCQGAGCGTMFLIQSGYTIIDNTWLWRADHTVNGKVYNGENPVDHGAVITADNVFAYGLAAEHTLKDNILWEGDNGETIFYQAEIAYDITTDTWPYQCYTVGDNVTAHSALGIGCYSYFRDHDVTAAMGATAPKENMLEQPFSVFLNGYGSIQTVADNTGAAVDINNPTAYIC